MTGILYLAISRYRDDLLHIALRHQAECWHGRAGDPWRYIQETKTASPDAEGVNE